MSVNTLDRRTLLAAAITAASLASPARAQAGAEAGLDGNWSGRLDNITGPGIAPPPNGEFPVIALHIDQRNVRVFFGGEEVKAGTFEIKREGRNAVISSIQSDPSSPDGQSWTETWTFIVTLASPDMLVVNYVRVVNNNNARPSENEAYFSQIRTGQFRRVTR